LIKIILDDFGISLGRKKNRFIIRKGKEKKEYPADDVDSIICTTSGASVTSSALRLAIKKNIRVTFAYHSGHPYGIVMPVTLTSSVRARRMQFQAYTERKGVTLAKEFVKGKLKNQANLIKLMAKNRKHRDRDLADILYNSGRVIDQIYTQVDKVVGPYVDVVRQKLINLEAEAARTYWSAISLILPSELGFTGRKTGGGSVRRYAKLWVSSCAVSGSVKDCLLCWFRSIRRILAC